MRSANSRPPSQGSSRYTDVAASSALPSDLGERIGRAARVAGDAILGEVGEARRSPYLGKWCRDAAGDTARRIARRVWSLPDRIIERFDSSRSVSLRPDGTVRGNVLLSYILDPFLLPPGVPLSNTHTNHWESREIANVFLEQGFAVDVIRVTNRIFVPRKPYAFLLDARHNLERLAPQLNPDCVKVAILDTAHMTFHNAAEFNRLLALYQRRGVTLAPSRFEIPNRGIEFADCATLLGNDFTVGTYACKHKPIYRLPVTPAGLHPPTRPRDFAACRRNFLWFNSRGMVHKGLDLALEAFAAMPDLTLTVCGPVHDEPEFVDAYRRELFETPNIRTVGWIDVGSIGFREILDNCVALISPSCSEGQSGSAVTCLHSGIIPILSRESGVDIGDDYGIVLETCSVEEIREAAQRIASLPADRLRDMSERTLAFARANHTRDRFAREYRNIVRDLMVDYHG